jgi:hypothetical protein
MSLTPACSWLWPAPKEMQVAEAVSGKTITIDMLREMFKRMEDGQGWDFSEPLLWGYFFTHREPEALRDAASKLKADGYRFVSVYLSDKEVENEPDQWWLHVEREETHTPETLDIRNDVLYRFAAEQGLDSYDGMDVGPIGGAPCRTPASS